MIANELRDLIIAYAILYFLFGMLYGTLIFIAIIILLQIGYNHLMEKQKKTNDYNMKKAVELMDKLFPKEQKSKVKK